MGGVTQARPSSIRRRGLGHPAKAYAGFTLIEVLVALSIVAVTLVTGIHASSALVQRSERAASLTMAKWCIGNLFNTLYLTREMPAVGDRAVTCEQADRRFDGHMSVRPTENPLFRRVEVSFNDGNGHVALRMVTLASTQ